MEIIYDYLKERLPLHLFRLKIQIFVTFNNIDPKAFNTSWASTQERQHTYKWKFVLNKMLTNDIFPLWTQQKFLLPLSSIHSKYVRKYESRKSSSVVNG